MDAGAVKEVEERNHVVGGVACHQQVEVLEGGAAVSQLALGELNEPLLVLREG